jgi:hypothetical protein
MCDNVPTAASFIVINQNNYKARITKSICSTFIWIQYLPARQMQAKVYIFSAE